MLGARLKVIKDMNLSSHSTASDYRGEAQSHGVKEHLL